MPRARRLKDRPPACAELPLLGPQHLVLGLCLGLAAADQQSATQVEDGFSVDSAGTGSRSDHVESYLGLGVVFTPSADLYIEQELRRIAAEGQRPVWAATADRAIQVAATNYGANVMSTKRLVEELKGSRAASATLVGEWNRQESSRRPVFLEDQVGAVQRGVLSGSLQGKLTQRERKALERGVE